jgi:hypothetical protein
MFRTIYLLSLSLFIFIFPFYKSGAQTPPASHEEESQDGDSVETSKPEISPTKQASRADTEKDDDSWDEMAEDSDTDEQR